MAGVLEGKVAFITGAARGQGRAHAVRMAEEGADIIAIDLCDQIDNVKYPLGSDEDLAETVRQVEALDRRIVARKADVRVREQLRAAVEEGVAELGHLDIMVANAGIMPFGDGSAHWSEYTDALDVDLIGVMNTVAVSLPHIPDGGVLVITGSTAGMMPGTVDNPALGPGGAGYGFAKQTLIKYTEHLSMILASRSIRVNAIHPTNVNTNLLHNQGIYAAFRPDLKNPTVEDVEPAFTYFNALPIPYIQPVDVANLAVFLCSEAGRYITGMQIRLDAGSLLKFPNGPGR